MPLAAPRAPLLSWRVLAAGICYLIFAVAASIPAALALGLKILPLDSTRRQRITRDSIRYLCRFYMNFMQLAGLLRFTVTDRSTAPVAGHVIVANHPTLIDALFVMAYVPDVCCIAKPGLARNIFTRMTLAQAGFLVADADDLMEQACARLHAGENVLIFPEGTRNTSDLELDFRRGAANLAVLADSPVLPVVIHCRPRILQRGDKWYQLPSERPELDIVIEPELVRGDCIDTSAPRTRQYRTLTRYLREYFHTRLAAAPGAQDKMV
ncbi:1-acyl-sn-glycerol-3-phosphate acyltransferase [Mangrovimicrobium sediminis]|uniref:1-acyl-sn-glycerol-3-phosphate acyltransferase n=1 Tax=Mangrovimicrobium sediminis TaxID=2562682 RepID=A0A4Z0LZ62_9GAMM|nr:lysophospholipid acyltransferase family protein [Haliea sp. SAOS-164]TGD72662.1 1-acyl-sn-glycerol-3-phosphate acyltransferase [Haliea sp. SAOS-164]